MAPATPAAPAQPPTGLLPGNATGAGRLLSNEAEGRFLWCLGRCGQERLLGCPAHVAELYTAAVPSAPAALSD